MSNNKVYKIGPHTFYSSREGGDFIGFSGRTFLNRYNAWKDGRLTLEDALSTERKVFCHNGPDAPGNAEWQALGFRERKENLERIPAATPFEVKHFPVPEAATGNPWNNYE